MKIIILGSGTSQGVPKIGCYCETCISKNPKDKRLRTSAYIETQGQKILIDTSVDFRQQMLNNNITDLDAILYTHHHVDHILGLDDVRQINQLHKKYIDLYGNNLTMEEIKTTFRYAFNEEMTKHLAVPLIKINKIENKNFKIRNIDIIPIEVMHGKLPIFGYRIGNFAYITDCSRIPETELKKLKGLDVLILNALRIEPHPTHLNVEEAVRMAEKLKPKKTYLTHMTHDINHDKINSELPKHIELAYDGLTININ